MKTLSNIISGLISVILCVAFSAVIVFALAGMTGLCSPSPANTQSVCFINMIPNTALGLVKFTLDENDKAIDYTILDERWTEPARFMDLEPGLYGVTHYQVAYNRIIGYKNFWVKDQPIILEFR